MKHLIVNADDFGYSDGVNRGILHGHERGIVTSTTVMINYPHAPTGIEQALRDAPDLGLGLHVNLTSGTPVSAPGQIPSLVDANGWFHDIRAWGERHKMFAAEEIEREITAQFERFVALAGRPPDHLDAHHHSIYFHPAAVRTALRLAHAYHLPLRNLRPVMSPQGMIQTVQGMISGLTDAEAQRIMDEVDTAITAGPAPFWPARLEMGFYGERATLGELLVLLTTLPDDSITEIMCHPGYNDEGLAHSRYRDGRETELDHLCHAATVECVKSEGLQLITFGDVSALNG